MKQSPRNQAAQITAEGAITDLDGNTLAPAGTVSGTLYLTQAGHEVMRYRPAQVRPDGAVIDLDGRVLAESGTVKFEK